MLSLGSATAKTPYDYVDVSSNQVKEMGGANK